MEAPTFISSNQIDSLLMNEFTFRLAPKTKSTQPQESYISSTADEMQQQQSSMTQKALDKNIALMYSKMYTPLFKSLMQSIFTIYGPKTSPEVLQLVENILKINPNQSYLHFGYQLEQMFLFNRMPHSYVPHTIKIELQENINRDLHAITVTSSGTNIRLNLLGPTKKEQLICQNPVLPISPPIQKVFSA